MLKIAPTIISALGECPKAMRLYRENDNFAKTVLLSLLSLDVNAKAEKIASQSGLKHFKLDWSFESFFALKCAVLACRKNPQSPDANAIFLSNGLRVSDTLVLKDIKRLRLKSAVDRVAVMHKPDISVAASMCSQFITDLRRFFYARVKQKLYFLLKFYHDKSIDDLVSQMNEKAIYAFYRSYPMKTKTHLFNSMRVAGYNYALNIIEHSTRKKRAEIVMNENETFTVTSRSMSEVIGGEDSSSPQTLGDTIADPNDTFEAIDYQRFLSKCSVKELRALYLLQMEPDAEFMQHLRDRNMAMSSVKSLQTAFNELGTDAYQREVRKFVGLGRKPYQQFVDTLKVVLSPTP